MGMQRRDFLKAGAAGVALSLAQGAARAEDAPATTATSATGEDLGQNLVVISVDGSTLSSEMVDKYKRNGADVWLFDGPRTLPRFSRAFEFLDRESSKITLCRSHKEILAAKRDGKVAMVFGWQDSEALEEEYGNDWRDHKPPLTNLRAWYELGLRVAGLQYNMANQFGGGCLDPTVPLTIQGKYLVAQMQDMGILVDCGGHIGEQTSLGILAMARRPVVCTHSNVLALNDNPRNTSDRVIEGIAKTGGVFGVTAMDGFMTWSRKDAPKAMTGPFPPRAGVPRYVDEFDYLKRLVGVDHIGLGPDWVNDLEPLDPSNSIEFPPEMTYVQPVTMKLVEGFESVDGLGNVRAEMEKRGYTAEEIAKIFGGNWMRVYREAWNS
jgi:membrane dipeptidase